MDEEIKELLRDIVRALDGIEYQLEQLRK